MSSIRAPLAAWRMRDIRASSSGCTPVGAIGEAVEAGLLADVARRAVGAMRVGLRVDFRLRLHRRVVADVERIAVALDDLRQLRCAGRERQRAR